MKKNKIKNSFVFITVILLFIAVGHFVRSYNAPILCSDIVGQHFDNGSEFDCAVEINSTNATQITDGDIVLVSDQFADNSLDIVGYDTTYHWAEIRHDGDEVAFRKNGTDAVTTSNKDYLDLTFHVYQPIDFQVEVQYNYDGTYYADEPTNFNSEDHSEITCTNEEGGGEGSCVVDGFCNYETGESCETCPEDCCGGGE